MLEKTEAKKEGFGFKVVVGDFGSANLIGSALARRHRLVKGLKSPTNLGITIQYASPEVNYMDQPVKVLNMT